MDRQEFIDRYLNTIIRFRKEYLALDTALKNSSASEVKLICEMQSNIAQRLVRFILRPQAYMEFKDAKLIEQMLDK